MPNLTNHTTTSLQQHIVLFVEQHTTVMDYSVHAKLGSERSIRTWEAYCHVFGNQKNS